VTGYYKPLLKAPASDVHLNIPYGFQQY